LSSVVVVLGCGGDGCGAIDTVACVLTFFLNYLPT
jgi:hypothetical protein